MIPTITIPQGAATPGADWIALLLAGSLSPGKDFKALFQQEKVKGSGHPAIAVSKAEKETKQPEKTAAASALVLPLAICTPVVPVVAAVSAPVAEAVVPSHASVSKSDEPAKDKKSETKDQAVAELVSPPKQTDDSATESEDPADPVVQTAAGSKQVVIAQLANAGIESETPAGTKQGEVQRPVVEAKEGKQPAAAAPVVAASRESSIRAPRPDPVPEPSLPTSESTSSPRPTVQEKLDIPESASVSVADTLPPKSKDAGESERPPSRPKSDLKLVEPAVADGVVKSEVPRALPIAGVEMVHSVTTNRSAHDVKAVPSADGAVEIEPPGKPAVAFQAVRLAERMAGPELHFAWRSPDAGQIQVSTSLHQRDVQIVVNTERTDAANAIRAELPALNVRLNEHSLRLGEVSVVAQESTVSCGLGMAGQQRGRGNGQEYHAALPLPLSEGTNEAVESQPWIQSKEAGRVSVLA